MIPRLNKLNKKNIILAAIFVFLLLVSSSLIPALRIPIINNLKYPLNFLTLIRREAGGIIFYHRNLVENQRLKKEINLLRQRLNTTEEIRLENRRLENLLSLKQKASYKVIAARVIARAPDNWSSVAIIDRGRFHGIKPGLAVVTYLGMVGRVIETATSTSKIILINDPSLGVSGIVQRSRQEGLVSGTLGNSLIMRYLPRDSDICVSDVIITSGLTEAYPKGLFIGTVVAIGDEFSRLSRYAIIKPAVNLSNIEEALIIAP